MNTWIILKALSQVLEDGIPLVSIEIVERIASFHAVWQLSCKPNEEPSKLTELRKIFDIVIVIYYLFWSL